MEDTEIEKDEKGSDDVLHRLMHSLVSSLHVWSSHNEKRWDDSTAAVETSGSDADEILKVMFLTLTSIAH